MDRHMKWLRRRIIASVATQTAETFALVAVVAFAIMQWRTSEGPLSSLFGAVVIAQLFAVARLGHAMRNNPLNYVFMRKYVERPFSYRVARFQGDEEAHSAAHGLPGFAPVATIRDAAADPEPVFDIYHDPSRLVAASVSRASGALSLISSLVDGRILVTDARAMPPHERLVMSLAGDDSIETVIATHQRAVASRNDVVELASSAHQVVLDSLTIEYDSYLALGPALSPFLDLEPAGRSPLRLVARIKTEELVTLPVRLGPDKPLPAVRVAAPTPERTQSQSTVPVDEAPEVISPQVVAPDIAALEIAALDLAPLEIAAPVVAALDIGAITIAAPVVAEPLAAAPALVQPEISALEVSALEVSALEVSALEVSALEVSALEMTAPPAPPAPPVPEAPAPPPPPVLVNTVEPLIAPPVFVTVEPEPDDFVDTSEPITAEVPAVTFTGAAVPEPIPVAALVAHHLAVLQSEPFVSNVVDSAFGSELAAQPPAPPAPEPAPTPVARPTFELPEAAPGQSPVFAPLPQFSATPPVPPATLAEAVVSAPDTPAALIDGVPAFDRDISFADIIHPPETATEPAGVVGFANVIPRERPRLSEVLRQNPAKIAAEAAGPTKRSRRKSR